MSASFGEQIVSAWADIGSEAYWADLLQRQDFVPFKLRWPQPGFIGERYFAATRRLVVMGQNPRASNTSRASAADLEMFRLIREHSRLRSTESLETLFEMMRKFMLGIEHKPAWKPITMATGRLGVKLDEISYLNLIPLATWSDQIVGFEEPFARATKRQLDLLAPSKIVVYGKGAYEAFLGLGGRRWDVRYVEQRDYRLVPDVRTWLHSVPDTQ